MSDSLTYIGYLDFGCDIAPLTPVYGDKDRKTFFVAEPDAGGRITKFLRLDTSQYPITPDQGKTPKAIGDPVEYGLKIKGADPFVGELAAFRDFAGKNATAIKESPTTALYVSRLTGDKALAEWAVEAVGALFTTDEARNSWIKTEHTFNAGLDWEQPAPGRIDSEDQTVELEPYPLDEPDYGTEFNDLIAAAMDLENHFREAEARGLFGTAAERDAEWEFRRWALEADHNPVGSSLSPGDRSDTSMRLKPSAFIEPALILGKESHRTRRALSFISRTLRKRGRLLITGAVGSGKTTLLRQAALECARAFLPTKLADAASKLLGPQKAEALQEACHERGHDTIGAYLAENMPGHLSQTWKRFETLGFPTGNWGGRLPVFVDFRHHGEIHGPNMVRDVLDHAPLSDVTRHMLEESPYFHRKTFYVIDGVDEGPDHVSNRLITRVLDTLVLRPRASVLLARRDGIEPSEDRPGNNTFLWGVTGPWKRTTLAPFGPRKIKNLIDQRYGIYGIGRATPAERRNEKEARRLFSHIKSRSGLLEIAGSPLFCSMFCDIYMQTGSLGETTTNAVERLVEAILTATMPLQTARDKHKLQKILSNIAIESTGIDLIESIQSAPNSGEKIDIFRDYFYNDKHEFNKFILNNMFFEKKSDDIRFFQDFLLSFFIGVYLLNHKIDSLPASNWAHPNWADALVFSAGLGGRTYTNRLFPKILETAMDVDRPEQIRRAGVALRCAREGFGFSERVTEFFKATLNRLLQPETMALAEDVARLGDEAVSFLAYSPDVPARSRAACIRALRLIGTTKAKSVLKGYLNDHTKPVVAELARVPGLNPLEIAHYRKAIVTDGVLFEDWAEENRQLASKVTDLKPLKHLTGLRHLALMHTKVTDLTPLQNQTLLKHLDLSNSNVSDLTPLQDLTDLQTLHLAGTKVTDLSSLRNLRDLRQLDLQHTLITRLLPVAHMDGLEVRLPNGEIWVVGSRPLPEPYASQSGI